MISCKECATLNSLDSGFCKKCGKALAQEDAIDARDKLEKHLDQAFELFHHGRTDEAALLTETALASDPTSLRALSLRGMILERKGLIVEALETYEMIVARDPNAALERMKIQTLRGVLDVRRFAAPQANRKVAMVIAACTMLVIVALAAVLISSNRRPAEVAVETPVKQSVGDTFGSTVPASAGVKQTPADTDRNATKDQQTPTQAQSSAPNQTPPTNTTSLPKAAAEGTLISPLDPLKGAQIQQLPAANQIPAATTGTQSQPPTKGDPDPSAVTQKTQQKQPDPPAIVDIKLSSGDPTPGSDSAIDRNGIDALVRSAKGQFMEGNYQAAAGTYARALGAGADPALINQRLGQCYEHLGRNSDAIDAYSKAIAASENAINKGKGDRVQMGSILASSRQALKNLQGG